MPTWYIGLTRPVLHTCLIFTANIQAVPSTTLSTYQGNISNIFLQSPPVNRYAFLLAKSQTRLVGLHDVEQKLSAPGAVAQFILCGAVRP